MVFKCTQLEELFSKVHCYKIYIVVHNKVFTRDKKKTEPCLFYKKWHITCWNTVQYLIKMYFSKQTEDRSPAHVIDVRYS